jgi:hypothetical protein
MNQCFECDKTENLHKHHVIPRSLGGERTLLLCPECHGKIHGLDFSNHGNLIKLGIAKTEKKLGRPCFGEFDGEEEIIKMIRALRRKSKGGKRLSLARVAEILNQDGVPSREGKPWRPEVVRRILMAESQRQKAKKELLINHSDIVELLKEGKESIRNIAKITGKGGSTVQRVKKEYESRI